MTAKLVRHEQPRNKRSRLREAGGDLSYRLPLPKRQKRDVILTATVCASAAGGVHKIAKHKLSLYLLGDSGGVERSTAYAGGALSSPECDPNPGKNQHSVSSYPHRAQRIASGQRVLHVCPSVCALIYPSNQGDATFRHFQEGIPVLQSVPCGLPAPHTIQSFRLPSLSSGPYLNPAKHPADVLLASGCGNRLLVLLQDWLQLLHFQPMTTQNHFPV